MKRLLTAVVLVAALASACGPEIESFNQAADFDRAGREKMTASLSLLAEYNVLRESPDPELRAQGELKLQEALDAYKIAVSSWDEAKDIYQKLIDTYADDADYYNNIGTLLYMELKTGLIGDYDAAEQALTTAISKHDRPLYQRNLELLRALKKPDGQFIDEVRENKRVVEELRVLAEQ